MEKKKEQEKKGRNKRVIYKRKGVGGTKANRKTAQNNMRMQLHIKEARKCCWHMRRNEIRAKE